MQAHPSRFLVLSALAAFAGASPLAASDADAFPTFESFIKLSAQGVSLTGDQNAYAQRFRSPSEGGVGLEALHYYRDLSRETSVTLDGRALAGLEDYLASFKIAKVDVGSVDVGYKRFRTFYDGIGGFFPINGFWRPLAQQDLHTDRGHFWAEGKLNLPGKPQVTLRYDNLTRDGKKSSISWGDSNLTGLPLLPANNATRKVIPGELKMDERQQTLEGRVEHKFGQTTAIIRLIGNWVNNSDTRKVFRFPGEVTPSPQRVTEHRDAIESRDAGVIVTTATPLSARVSLDTGVSYKHVTATLGGDRANAVGDLPTYDFKNLAGESTSKDYTANVSLGLKPTPAWVVRLTVRGQDTYTKSNATYNRVTGTFAVPVTTVMNVNSRVKDRILTPDVSVRYTGVPRLVLYGSASDRIDRGDRRHVAPFSTVTPALGSIFGEDVEQDQAQYRLGANWNQSVAFVARGEVFRKNHQNKFIGYENRLGDRYVVGYNFTGLKLTAIAKPLPELSFTTRYVPQTGYIDVTTNATARWDSMTAKSHLVSETIDWSPSPRLYFQVGVDVGFNYISTAYPKAQTPINKAPQVNSDNNYVVQSFLSGFAMDKKTDLQLQATHQHAHNYQPELAAGTQPYGAGYSEDTITLGLKHRLASSWLVTAKAGYVDNRSEMTGGNTNFRGPLGYVAFEHEL